MPLPRCIRWSRLLAVLLPIAAASAYAAGPAVELVRPSAANAAVTQYDDPNVVIDDDSLPVDAPLAIFLPGTGGRPQNVLPLLQVVRSQGYRVIGLSYNDEPAVMQVCPREPNPGCAAAFRSVRVFGEGSGPVSNPAVESIQARLADLIRYLDRTHPDRQWRGYLQTDGTVAWNRVLVSGLSQGAGMAAFIAKRHAVYRAVLFSSPWDSYGRDRRLAPWLSDASATPPERWWAERHLRENAADQLAAAYRKLGIPDDHIQLFDNDLPAGLRANGDNPYHGSTVKDLRYEPQWRWLYGTPTMTPKDPAGTSSSPDAQ